MRISIKTLSATAATGLIAALAGAVPAHAATTHTVSPGESIQAAIDAAAPGDTIVVEKGTYHEALAIGPGKDGLTIIGQGASLLPPSSAPAQGTNLCVDMGDEPGFCIHGDITATGPESPIVINSTIKNVTIQGFKISDFPGEGIFGLATENLTVNRNLLFHNGEYGVFVNTSTGAKVTNNFAVDSDEAGIYIGDSPNTQFATGLDAPANATVTGNRSFGSAFGIFLRDASSGTVSNNNLMNNCVGVMMLADAPGPVEDWTITGNHVSTNVKGCPPSDEGTPPLSGLGILLVGASNNTISDNHVWYNQANGNDSAVSGGIVLLQDPTNPNATTPSGNTVSGNDAHGNKPADIFYDGSGTGNTFTGNSCDTAIPSQISCTG